MPIVGTKAMARKAIELKGFSVSVSLESPTCLFVAPEEEEEEEEGDEIREAAWAKRMIFLSIANWSALMDSDPTQDCGAVLGVGQPDACHLVLLTD